MNDLYVQVAKKAGWQIRATETKSIWTQFEIVSPTGSCFEGGFDLGTAKDQFRSVVVYFYSNIYNVLALMHCGCSLTRYNLSKALNEWGCSSPLVHDNGFRTAFGPTPEEAICKWYLLEEKE
jgi:hypothetical protein